MENMGNIENILKDLENCIEILIEAMGKKESVSLINNDTFRSIPLSIKELEKYDNKSLREVFWYYRATLVHLNKIFNSKEYISNEMLDSVVGCLNDIKTLKNKISINLPFNKFFEDLKRVYRNLNGINSNLFLRDSNNTETSLVNYENIITKYKSVIDNINELKADMNSEDFDNLKLDLNINYNAFKANLNEIYREILVSNIDIADPILNKLKIEVGHENYESVLETSMVNKVVNNGIRRKEIINNYNMLIESLEKIIDRYKDCKVDMSHANIDVKISNDEIPEDFNIDIPHFIEDNYNEHREFINRNKSNNQNSTYDSKVAGFIARFEILKRKFQNKKSLTKEEVRLYNKLESELDNLMMGKGSFTSGFKINYYYNKLNKKIKLYKKNYYKQLYKDEETKKRK